MKIYKYNTYTVRLSDELNAYVKHKAKTMGLSVQNVIRLMLSEKMAEDKRKR